MPEDSEQNKSGRRTPSRYKTIGHPLRKQIPPGDFPATVTLLIASSQGVLGPGHESCKD
jgi:hypothetical protein